MIRVKDGRKIGWHWANNEIIDHYASRIGMQGYAIYMYLSRYSSSDSGECCRSHSDIAETFGVSRHTILRHIETLIEHGLLQVTEENGKPNLYTLTDPQNLSQIATGSKMEPVAKTIQPLSQIATAPVAKTTTHIRK